MTDQEQILKDLRSLAMRLGLERKDNDTVNLAVGLLYCLDVIEAYEKLIADEVEEIQQAITANREQFAATRCKERGFHEHVPGRSRMAWCYLEDGHDGDHLESPTGFTWPNTTTKVTVPNWGEQYISGTGQSMRVHRAQDCVISPEAPWCVIHKPMPGPWSTWRTHWRADRRIMERVCPHGVGHPAAEYYLYATRPHLDHGCDTCVCCPGSWEPAKLDRVTLKDVME